MWIIPFSDAHLCTSLHIFPKRCAKMCILHIFPKDVHLHIFCAKLRVWLDYDMSMPSKTDSHNCSWQLIHEYMIYLSDTDQIAQKRCAGCTSFCTSLHIFKDVQRCASKDVHLSKVWERGRTLLRVCKFRK